MKTISLLLIPLIVLGFTSCKKKTRGCMDMNSLNYNAAAEESDGSCKFSTATFYARYGYYNGIPITSIDVNVNGSAVGTITSIYPTAPGNCGAQGTVGFGLAGSKSAAWNTVVHLANGATVFGSGTTAALAGVECVKVNVTQ